MFSSKHPELDNESKEVQKAMKALYNLDERLKGNMSKLDSFWYDVNLLPPKFSAWTSKYNQMVADRENTQQIEDVKVWEPEKYIVTETELPSSSTGTLFGDSPRMPYNRTILGREMHTSIGEISIGGSAGLTFKGYSVSKIIKALEDSQETMEAAQLEHNLFIGTGKFAKRWKSTSEFITECQQLTSLFAAVVETVDRIVAFDQTFCPHPKHQSQHGKSFKEVRRYDEGFLTTVGGLALAVQNSAFKGIQYLKAPYEGAPDLLNASPPDNELEKQEDRMAWQLSLLPTRCFTPATNIEKETWAGPFTKYTARWLVAAGCGVSSILDNKQYPFPKQYTDHEHQYYTTGGGYGKLKISVPEEHRTWNEPKMCSLLQEAYTYSSLFLEGLEKTRKDKC